MTAVDATLNLFVKLERTVSRLRFCNSQAPFLIPNEVRSN